MNHLACAAAGALLGCIYVFPGAAAQAARDGLSLWALTLVPALGPAMALCLYVCTHLGKKRRLMLLAAVLCGSPGGARLMQEGKLQGQAAARCAAFTGVMSPMFFLGAVSGWLGSTRAAAVYFCHLLAACLTGLCIRGKGRPAFSVRPLSFSHCVQQSVQALLHVGLILTTASVAAEMAANALPFLPESAAVALHCLLEITGGAARLCLSPSPLRLPLLCAAVSFGGLSILAQNSIFWQQSGLGPGKLAVLRGVHGLIAFLLCFFLQNVVVIG